MSDANGMFWGYPCDVMAAPGAKQLEIRATNSKEAQDAEPGAPKNVLRSVARKHGISVLQRYEQVDPNAVRDALARAMRRTRQAQIVGGLTAIVISMTLLIISANGVAVALATFICGVTAGFLTIGYGIRQDARSANEDRHTRAFSGQLRDAGRSKRIAAG